MIGGFELAAEKYNVKTIYASEIDPIAVSIHKRHFPDCVQLGDITKIHGACIAPVDIITAGFPCQDLSVAGKGAGLKSNDGYTRSGLVFEAFRVIREMLEAHKNQYPKYIILENVMGFLGSNKGKDFSDILVELQNLGCGFIIDANALNAADFGVAQRRKRVFIVAVNTTMIERWSEYEAGGEDDFGSGQVALDIDNNTNNPKYERLTSCASAIVRRFRKQRNGQILSLSESCARDIKESRKTRKETAYGATRSSGTSIGAVGVSMQSNCYLTGDIAGTIIATRPDAQHIPCVIQTLPITIYDARGNGNGNVSPTLVGNHQNRITDYTALCVYALDQQGGKSQCNFNIDVCSPLMSDSHGTPHAIAYSFDGLNSNSMKSDNPNSGCRKIEVAKTLDTTNQDPSKNQGGIAILESVYSIDRAAFSQGENAKYDFKIDEELSATLVSKGPNAVMEAPITIDVPIKKSVRRLTPKECERLQGFPDNWTQHSHDDKDISDTSRYRCIGNSVAIPCVDFIFQRILSMHD